MAYLLFLLIYGNCYSELNKWGYGYCHNYIDFLREILSAHVWITRGICALLLWTWILWLRREWIDTHSSRLKLGISIFLLFFSYFTLSEFLNIGTGVSKLQLSEVFNFICFCSFVVLIAKWMNSLIHRQPIPSVDIVDGGFTTDQFNISKDSRRYQYAEKLVQKLQSTQNSNESFAVVVYGSWGAGKTVFLDSLQLILQEKRLEVFKFNPWSCNTPDMIRSDFMALLLQKLAPYDSSLSSPMRKYEKLFAATELPTLLQYVVSLIYPQGKNSVAEQKEKIKKTLASLCKPVYVLIDDLDRLNDTEILEVITLIRNFANFPYLKFVVACDKEYVSEQLGRLGIGMKYLEKIFPLELPLPVIYEDNPYSHKMFNEIQRMIPKVKELGLLHTFSSKQHGLVNQCLGSFRQAQRFARQFVLNFEFVIENVTRAGENVIKNELFWLELIKFYDYKLYERIQGEPLLFFNSMKHPKLHVNIYILKKKEDIKERLNKIGFTDENIDIAYSLLLQLFPVQALGIMRSSSICFLENFDKYFSCGLTPHRLTFTEFYDLIHKDLIEDDLDNIYVGWLNSHLLESVYNRIMMEQDTGKMVIVEAKRYVYLIWRLCEEIYSWSDLRKETLLKDLVSEKFNKLIYSDKIVEELKSYLLQIMTRQFNTDKEMTVAAQICALIGQQCINKKFHPLLEKTDTDSVIQENMKTYLNQYNLDASDAVNTSSSLHTLLDASGYVYPVLDGNDEYDYEEYANPAADIVIEYFSNHKSVRWSAYHKFEAIETEVGDDPNLIEDLKDGKYQEIQKLFGSYRNFEEFKQKCFIHTGDSKNNYNHLL